MRHGFTKNLSVSGALITGNDLPGRGALLRVELVGKEAQRVVYGRVVHAHRVPPELRRFAESAMGVRFLRRDELMSPFLDPESLTREEVADEPEGFGGGEVAEEWPISGGRFAEGGEDAEAQRAEFGAGTPGSGSRPGQGEGMDEGKLAGPGMAQVPPGTGEVVAGSGLRSVDSRRSYSLTYETPKEFLTAFRRDLVNGGLFVATEEPAGLYDTVTVELHLPPPVRQVFRFQARVVQAVEPRQLPGGHTGGGVGLEVLDTDRVLNDLRPVVDLLK